MPERPARPTLRQLFAAERRRPTLFAFGALASAAVAAGIILGAGLSGTSAGASQPAKSAGAATVQRRDLVQTDTEPGTLSYASPHTVFNRLSGTVTSLPAVGQTIRPGQTLYTVDGSPAVLMTGTVPAYRTLTAGVSNGTDVQELEQNLVTLGFDPSRQIVIDQSFDTATTAAVDRWQASLGETQTGTVTLGQVVFLPGSQRVTAVDTTLGSTGGSGSSGASGSSGSSGTSTGASTSPAPARPQFVNLTTTTTTTSSTTTTPSKPSGGKPGKPGNARKPGPGSQPTSMAALLALLKAETAELLKLRATSGASGAGAAGGATGSTGSRSSAPSATKSTGGGASASTSAAGASGSSGGSTASGAGASAQAIFQTTSTNLVVTVALDATKQSEAAVGAPVTVQMPDGTTLDGKITAVSPVAQTSSSSSSSSGSTSGGSSSTPSATVPITITLRNGRHVNGLDQAAVSVNFQQQKAKNVLSVPVSALLATAGGNYSVQEASAPHRLIPVTPGLFAAGYVQISGAGIFSGLQVTDSQG